MTKYGNKKTNGYDSRRESAFADKLYALQSIGEVAEIEKQVSYVLIPAQRDADKKLIERMVQYKADFRVTYADGRIDVIDVKGFKTKDYILKRKMMLFIHGIRIKEV